MKTVYACIAVAMIFSYQPTLQAASTWNTLYKETELLLQQDDSDTATIARNIQQLLSNAAKLGGISYLNRVSRLSATLDIRQLLERGDIKQAEKSLKMYGAAGTVAPIAAQLQEKIEKAKQQEQQRMQARAAPAVQKIPYTLPQKYEPYKPAVPKPVHQQPITRLPAPVGAPTQPAIVQQQEPRVPTPTPIMTPVFPERQERQEEQPSLEKILEIDNLGAYIKDTQEFIERAQHEVEQVFVQESDELDAQINTKKLELEKIIRKIPSVHARDHAAEELRALYKKLLQVKAVLDKKIRDSLQKVVESGKASGAQVVEHALRGPEKPSHEPQKTVHQEVPKEAIREPIQQDNDAWLAEKIEEIKSYINTLHKSQSFIDTLEKRSQRWNALLDKSDATAQKLRKRIEDVRGRLLFAVQDGTQKINDIDKVLKNLSPRQAAASNQLLDLKNKITEQLGKIEYSLSIYPVPKLQQPSAAPAPQFSSKEQKLLADIDALIFKAKEELQKIQDILVQAKKTGKREASKLQEARAAFRSVTSYRDTIRALAATLVTRGVATTSEASVLAQTKVHQADALVREVAKVIETVNDFWDEEEPVAAALSAPQVVPPAVVPAVPLVPRVSEEEGIMKKIEARMQLLEKRANAVKLTLAKLQQNKLTREQIIELANDAKGILQNSTKSVKTLEDLAKKITSSERGGLAQGKVVEAQALLEEIQENMQAINAIVAALPAEVDIFSSSFFGGA